ncbi:hypothetical protein L195_g064528 [Trifolium pratense]|uniref:Uncharacterized protein n=1 Tax=Trifolium pratense TaxID=57577 RepID=A0A2K3KTP0_TRIPR|nr:hypothetical protein L195_g064528 [Trifolium pratense]
MQQKQGLKQNRAKQSSTTPGAQYNHARRDLSIQRKEFSECTTRGGGVYHALREAWRKNGLSD